jgi:anaerobic selenocysteine-containing dehydrogenase
MGVGSERHDLHSYEQYDGRWIGFRQPVTRVARERLNQPVTDTRQANPGEVWEENEFWIELSWRIDPDGTMGIRKYFESQASPAQKLTLDEYYGYIFENSVPGLPEKAAVEGLTPLGYMRKYGVFEIEKGVGKLYEQEVPKSELEDVQVDRFGRIYTKTARPVPLNIVPQPTPENDQEGRRPAGVLLDNKVVRGFPTPSGKLEFYSRTLAEWGWPEYALPGYIKSHVHPDNLEEGQIPLIPTFRLPVQIHTRSGNSKWLDEIAHTNPLWLHTDDAERLGVRTGELVRVETQIGYFVVKAWVTEGIRPGVVACSHHMGRWRLNAMDSGRSWRW